MRKDIREGVLIYVINEIKPNYAYWQSNTTATTEQLSRLPKKPEIKNPNLQNVRSTRVSQIPSKKSFKTIAKTNAVLTVDAWDYFPLTNYQAIFQKVQSPQKNSNHQNLSMVIGVNFHSLHY